MVVLLVDALGWELAEKHGRFAPSLPHRRKIETILGFSSGALPTLFTGRMPEEHGRWLMYRRAQGETPFRGFGALRLLPERVQRSGRLARLLTRTVARRGVRGYFHLYEVPRWLLAEFDLAEREDPFAPGGLPGDSLWDHLERRGVRWRRWNWRTPEDQNLAALARQLAEGDEDLLFCYTAELDTLLHVEGSRGAGVQARLERYPEWIETLEREAARRGERLWVYLFSDHGMVDVTRTVDVAARLRALPVRWPRDYLVFLDATMARFWWRGEKARALVREALDREPHGHWLDDATLAREGARFPNREYGEDLFLLAPGAMVVPSFMGTSPLKAMHGYDASHPDMAAGLWSNRPLPDGVRHLRDLRGFLESELEALAREAAA